MTPAISQWPTVVSLPADFSCIRAYAPTGDSIGFRSTSYTVSSAPSILRRPSFVIFGMLRTPLVAHAQRVLLPSSPYAAASGSSPMPKLSRTTTKTRLGILPPKTPETSICARCVRELTYVDESLLFIKYIITVA